MFQTFCRCFKCRNRSGLGLGLGLEEAGLYYKTGMELFDIIIWVWLDLYSVVN